MREVGMGGLRVGSPITVIPTTVVICRQVSKAGLVACQLPEGNERRSLLSPTH